MEDSASVAGGAERDERLGKLGSAERRILAMAENLPVWDRNLTADELIREGKEHVARHCVAAEALADLGGEA